MQTRRCRGDPPTAARGRSRPPSRWPIWKRESKGARRLSGGFPGGPDPRRAIAAALRFSRSASDAIPG